jgi:PQQ-dependent dehydrogenase (s-GDH family)
MATAWLLLLAWATTAVQSPVVENTIPGPERFSMQVLATGLEDPWELLWGPDGRIWAGERAGHRITRINPADGSRATVLVIPDVMRTHSQDGLLGLAFDAGFLKGSNYLYAVLTYADAAAGGARRMKVRRYTYDRKTETLGGPVDVIDGLPAGSDHLSGRLVFGRDGKLYLTIGDQGYNQLGLYCTPIRAQVLPTAAQIAARDWREYEGKVLRINVDGSVPADNPMFGGVRSHIYTVGHRNAQGLAMTPDGKLYASEHGPSMDDELNVIVAGKNYGWPHVAGHKDDRGYVYNQWSRSAPESCASLKFTEPGAPPSVPQEKESAWSHPDFVPPVQTFFTVSPDYNFQQGFATIAPSGIDVYAVPTGGIPGWFTSVLVTGMSRGAIYRVKLGRDGDTAAGSPLEYFNMQTRYRDVLVSPDGLTIYAATDSSSRQHPGAILAFTYRR